MAKQEKEKCSKCGSDDFAVALKNDKPDPNGKRYCKKCQHVWVPNLEGMKRPDVLLHHAQKEAREMREALDVERKAHVALQRQVRDATDLAALKALVGPASTEEEIFS